MKLYPIAMHTEIWGDKALPGVVFRNRAMETKNRASESALCCVYRSTPTSIRDMNDTEQPQSDASDQGLTR